MATNITVCDIDPETKELLKKFRFSKSQTNRALTFKINPEKLLVVPDEEFDGISLEDLREELPSHLPRYIVYSYKHSHDDGRISYPLIFIFVSPQGVKPDLHMMYAGSKLELMNEAGLTKVFEVRSADELTEEWLIEKLSFFR